jgi:hypothetical protein
MLSTVLPLIARKSDPVNPNIACQFKMGQRQLA